LGTVRKPVPEGDSHISIPLHQVIAYGKEFHYAYFFIPELPLHRSHFQNGKLLSTIKLT
jgi:hypothetical protein